MNVSVGAALALEDVMTDDAEADELLEGTMDDEAEFDGLDIWTEGLEGIEYPVPGRCED